MILGKLLGLVLKRILNKKVLVVLGVILVIVFGFLFFKSKILGVFGGNTTAEETPAASFACWDGSKVKEAYLCPPEPRNVSPTNNTSAQSNLSRNTSQILQKPNTETSPVVLENPIYPEVTAWTQEEILAAMGAVNPTYKLPVKRRVVYDIDKKGTYYFQGSSARPIEDPFWLLRNQYFQNSYEWTANNLRTNVYESPQYYLDLVASRQDDAGLKILSPETFAQWNEISCAKMTSCRNIVAINCTRGNHTLHVWNYYPEQPNTIDKRYTMTAMDDGGVSLNTFEEFYCNPA